MTMAGQRVLVTGAAGFLGANLCRRLLDEGAEVHAMVRSDGPHWRLEDVRRSLQLHAVDISDARSVDGSLAAVEPQTVFHLAALAGHPITPEERALALEVTVGGTANLLGALTSRPRTRLVHIGSSLEYGPSATPLAESSRLDPITYRGAVKAAASTLCRQFAREHDRDVVILRPFSVYGPWESRRRFITAALLAAIEDRELPLTGPGFRHDFVFVSDVAEACLRSTSLSRPRGEVLNVGSGMQLTNEEVVQRIRESLHLPLRTRPGAYPSRQVDTNYWVADMTRTEQLLGWRPRTDFLAGLAITVAWLREHGHIDDAA